MFDWLADLLLKSPVVGSGCPCCEGQKEQLKKMQKAVLTGQINAEEGERKQNCTCHSCAEESEKSFEEMTTTYRYRL